MRRRKEKREGERSSKISNNNIHVYYIELYSKKDLITYLDEKKIKVRTWVILRNANERI